MAVEIERKFLVQGDGWRLYAPGVPYRQGYVRSGDGRTVRVRIAGTQGYLTLKVGNQGLSKLEFEYPIPLEDAQQLLERMCDRPLIEKVRYRIPWGDLTWEVDEFSGDNQGLIIAEIELNHEDQKFTLPDWIGAEVTQDGRYYNANLVRYPYSQWT